MNNMATFGYFSARIWLHFVEFQWQPCMLAVRPVQCRTSRTVHAFALVLLLVQSYGTRDFAVDASSVAGAMYYIMDALTEVPY